MDGQKMSLVRNAISDDRLLGPDLSVDSDTYRGTFGDFFLRPEVKWNFNFEVTSRLSFQNLTIFIFQVNRNYDARAIIFVTLVIIFDSFWIRSIGGQIFANPHFVKMFQSFTL